MLSRLRSHSRGPRTRRASAGAETDPDPAESTASAATGRRAFGDASNRNSKKGKKGGAAKGGRSGAANGDDGDEAAKKPAPDQRGRQLRSSTKNASSSAAAASEADASQKTGKRGRGRPKKVKVEEEEQTAATTATATRRSTRKRTSSVGAEGRVTRSSSRGRSQAAKRKSTDDADEAKSKSAKRAKTTSKKSSSATAARVKKETQPATRSSSRSRSRTAPVKDEVKSEADEEASCGGEDDANDGVEPRNLSEEFLVPPEYRLERDTFDPTDPQNHTEGMAPQDFEEDEDVLKVAPYVADLFQHLYVAEGKDMPEPYMDRQPDINAKMRAILVDWLVEVHMKFRLVPETLYLCVNLIDRYCSLVDVKRSRLQLVGVTALLIACKYEEIYPPEVRDCVYITDRAYNRQDVLDMEQDILEKLGFRITVPTAYPFLLRFLHLVDASETVKFAASYYMERTLQEHDLLEYRPSVVCAAAVILALNNPSIREEDGETGDPPGMPKVLMEYTGFDEDELLEVAEIISTRVGEEPVTASRRQLIAVKRKFDHTKYRHVSVDFDDPSHRDIICGKKK